MKNLSACCLLFRFGLLLFAGSCLCFGFCSVKVKSGKEGNRSVNTEQLQMSENVICLIVRCFIGGAV